MNCLLFGKKCIYRPTQNELITNDIKVSKIYDAREDLKTNMWNYVR